MSMLNEILAIQKNSPCKKKHDFHTDRIYLYLSLNLWLSGIKLAEGTLDVLNSRLALLNLLGKVCFHSYQLLENVGAVGKKLLHVLHPLPQLSFHHLKATL